LGTSSYLDPLAAALNKASDPLLRSKHSCYEFGMVPIT